MMTEQYEITKRMPQRNLSAWHFNVWQEKSGNYFGLPKLVLPLVYATVSMSPKGINHLLTCNHTTTEGTQGLSQLIVHHHPSLHVSLYANSSWPPIQLLSFLSHLTLTSSPGYLLRSIHKLQGVVPPAVNHDPNLRDKHQKGVFSSKTCFRDMTIAIYGEARSQGLCSSKTKLWLRLAKSVRWSFRGKAGSIPLLSFHLSVLVLSLCLPASFPKYPSL